MAGTTPVSRLSPLNFKGLIDTHRAHLAATPNESRNRARNRVEQCWRCTECSTVHDWESEAEDCCAGKTRGAPFSNERACPVCRSTDVISFRDATDCCLWKDLDAPTRRALADRVEAGATWADALGMDTSKAVQA